MHPRVRANGLPSIQDASGRGRDDDPARSLRPGFVFLLSVIVIGTIAVITTISLLLLGRTAQQNSLTQMQALQARLNAVTCMEDAIDKLRRNGGYAGNESFTVPGGLGTCVIGPVRKQGNRARLCTQGFYGKGVEYHEVFLSRILPSTAVGYWRQVPVATGCSS